MQPATPTTTTTTVRTAEAFRKPHPIRGILWGLIMGIGAAAIAILLKIIPFDLVWALIVLGGGILLGILWSTLGPAKKPKGEPPWRPAEQVTGRPDWDAGPVPPSPPIPPDVEPLHIQPLDVEPLDIDPPWRTFRPLTSRPPSRRPRRRPMWRSRSTRRSPSRRRTRSHRHRPPPPPPPPR